MKLSSLLCFRKLLWISLVAMLLTSSIIVIGVNETSASPGTHFSVDPSEVRDVQPEGTFSIKINVSEAPTTYSWEIYLNWDPALLNVSNVEEGDFLHRWEENPFPPPDYVKKYDTQLAYTPLDDANIEGKTLVYCALLGPQPIDNWASGNGWLCTLNFTVTDYGGSLLNLSNTRLWDHVDAGYPAPTYYENLDGFFSNFHEIVITQVTASPTEVTEPDPVSVNVIVKNEGDFNESFSVTAYRSIGSMRLTPDFGTLAVTNLSPDSSQSLIFSWDDTTGAYAGNYTISAEASVVPGEVNTVNNKLVDGKVKVNIAGAPSPSFIYSPQSPSAGETVSFNSTSSDTDGGTITGWQWDLNGDGTIDATTENTSYTYVIPGIYTAILYVTDDSGKAAFAYETVKVTSNPVASFTYYPPKVLVSQPESFNSTSYDLDGYIVSWEWDFNNDEIVDATTENVTWTYTETGQYTVTLNVTDNDSLQSSIQALITVYAPPIASFTYSPQNPLINEVVTFDASASSDPDGTIVDYSWDFGDDQTGGGKIVGHTYTSFGNYAVTLNVTDNDGIKRTKSSEVRVIEVPIASFTFAPPSPLVFQTITFNASSSTPNGGSITSYFWDFGDDSFADEADPITSHAYTLADTYTVTLTVTDSEGLTSTATQSIVIGKLSSTILINAAPSSITTGETVTINGSITPERQGVTVTILYRLSGEDTWEVLKTLATDENSQYSHDWTPTAAGTYEVKARWEGDTNTLGKESDTKPITVHEAPTPDIFLYAVVAIIIVIILAVAIYLVKFRKKS